MAEYALEDLVRVVGEIERTGRVYRIAYGSDGTVHYHVLIAVTADEIQHVTASGLRGVSSRKKDVRA